MFALSPTGPYVCVNCGYSNNQTVFKIYGKNNNNSNGSNTLNHTVNPGTSHLKLTECLKCYKTVDEYVQLDNCILFLDAILQKQSFYRHILLNCQSDSKVSLKLAILFSLCDAYKKWCKINQSQHDKSYIELEFSFYVILLRTITESLLFYSILYVLFVLIATPVNSKNLISSLIICSFGKLFALPAILWAAELSPIIDILLELFLIISLVQCCRVNANNTISRLKAYSIVGSTIIIHSLMLYLLSNNKFIIN